MNTPIYPEVYSIDPNNKLVILRSMLELIARFGGYAGRVDYRGEVEVLVDSDENTLVWVPITDLDVPDTPTKN